MIRSRDGLPDARRIVFKLGTQVVTHDGVRLALGRLHGLVELFSAVRRGGADVVVVSSGAVGMGVQALGLDGRPASLGLRQACAAAGQGRLTELYQRAFGQLGDTAAQVLVTGQDLDDRDRALCLRTTLLRLLEHGAIPVLNENDSVSVRELMEYRGSDPTGFGFGDNDGLSARIAQAIDADLLVLLTNVDGLFSANPALDPTAERVSELGADDPMFGGVEGLDASSAGGTGGMASKLAAASLAQAAGVATLITSGLEPTLVARALAGEDRGTFVRPANVSSSQARRRRLATAPICGALIANDGAVAALSNQKASLLPIGVVGVEGAFGPGDVVEVRDGSGRIIGRGVVNYSAQQCRAVAGRHSDSIAEVLGFRGYDALIDRHELLLGDV